MQPNKKLKQNQRVLVLWHDSMADSRWASDTGAQCPDPPPIVSTGFVRSITDKFLTICSSVTEAGTLQHLSIPWAAVKEVKVCREN